MCSHLAVLLGFPSLVLGVGSISYIYKKIRLHVKRSLDEGTRAGGREKKGESQETEWKKVRAVVLQSSMKERSPKGERGRSASPRLVQNEKVLNWR